jgi:hypothetical protein
MLNGFEILKNGKIHPQSYYRLGDTFIVGNEIWKELSNQWSWPEWAFKVWWRVT